MPKSVNTPLTMGEALERYGYGKGKSERCRFLTYIVGIERATGEEIIDRRNPNQWYVSPLKVAALCPELKRASDETSVANELRRDIKGFVDRMEKRLSEVIANDPEILSLKRQVQRLQTTIDQLTGRG